jgi:hypothetical protein
VVARAIVAGRKRAQPADDRRHNRLGHRQLADASRGRRGERPAGFWNMGPPPGALPPMRMTASRWRITHPPAAEAQGALTLRPARGQHHGTDARAQIDRGGSSADYIQTHCGTICADWQTAALKLIIHWGKPPDRIGMVSWGRGGPTDG